MVRRESLTPAERSLRGRIGAYALHARHDARVTTAAARLAFNRRFLDLVDPGRLLSDEERTRRVEAARKAYFTRLAYLAARRRSEQSPKSKTERR